LASYRNHAQRKRVTPITAGNFGEKILTVSEKSSGFSWLAAVIALIVFAAILVILAAIASAIPSNQWWIRAWDFPRLAVLCSGVLVFLALCFVRFRWRWALGSGLLAALAYQAGHIWPYTILANVEARSIDVTDAERQSHCFVALSLNVLQDNRDYDRTLALIERENPDILVLMETDTAWIEAMEPVLAGFPHRFEAPLSNKYGLVFASRLAVIEGRLANLAEQATPSFHGVLQTRAGKPFRLSALHPRPPHPGQDTEERDAEIAIAAMMTRDSGMPTFTLGDFNDVGWSETSQLFRRTGRYVDPRVGRGFYATFPASLPVFRWPIDHVFFTEEFGLYSLSVGDAVGSDHLPVRAEVCLVPEESQGLNNPERAEADDEGDLNEVMQAYREDQVEERATGEE
jgi:endonuclease/exonuclease/phosphatase (EEP) superfamily protein YafD